MYGDTDSLFVHLPGGSKEEAFKIGRAIAEAVTAANPKDVVLQFEKVYMGSVLVSKKRYAGMAYEDEAQKRPHFDCKDWRLCAATTAPPSGSCKKRPRLLFTTRDASQVKDT